MLVARRYVTHQCTPVPAHLLQSLLATGRPARCSLHLFLSPLLPARYRNVPPNEVHNYAFLEGFKLLLSSNEQEVRRGPGPAAPCWPLLPLLPSLLLSPLLSLLPLLLSLPQLPPLSTPHQHTTHALSQPARTAWSQHAPRTWHPPPLLPTPTARITTHHTQYLPACLQASWVDPLPEGCPHSRQKVIGDFLRFLKEYLQEQLKVTYGHTTLNNRPVKYCFTIPAGWSEEAKHCMRQ
jgi:hypothetical protein